METEICNTADDTTGVVVLDDRRSALLPTGYVTVTAPAGVSDDELAEVAGFAPRHFGHNVTRYDDGTALVCLWND